MNKWLKRIMKSLIMDPHSSNKLSSLRVLLWISCLFYFCFLGKNLIYNEKIQVPKTLDTLVMTLVGGIALGKFQKKTEKEESIVINNNTTQAKTDKKMLIKEQNHDSDWKGK